MTTVAFTVAYLQCLLVVCINPKSLYVSVLRPFSLTLNIVCLILW